MVLVNPYQILIFSCVYVMLGIQWIQEFCIIWLAVVVEDAFDSRVLLQDTVHSKIMSLPLELSHPLTFEL